MVRHHLYTPINNPAVPPLWIRNLRKKEKEEIFRETTYGVSAMDAMEILAKDKTRQMWMHVERKFQS